MEEDFSLTAEEQQMLADLEATKRVPACIREWQERIVITEKLHETYMLLASANATHKNDPHHKDRIEMMEEELARRKALWVRGRIHEV
jgi:hypothetical protein